MSRRNTTFAVAAAALLAILVLAAGRVHFDWRSVGAELRSVSLLHVGLGVGCIYAGFVARAMRWATLMGSPASLAESEARPATGFAPAPESGRARLGRKRSGDALVLPLTAIQFIGFSAVALFGRLADLTRPYLAARRTGTTVAAQVAVYSVERIFDLAAAAIIFSSTLALAPRDLPHHATYVHAGFISLAGTSLLAVFTLLLRFAGVRIAALAERLLRPLSAGFAAALAARILDFQAGLRTLRTPGQLAGSLVLSLLLWLGIAEAYVQTMHAFGSTPQLAGLSFTQTMLLLATSMGGSLLQLPVLGWFTQIGLLAAALHEFFAAPAEAATAASAVLLFVTTLSIVPAGALAARLTGTGLRVNTGASESE